MNTIKILFLVFGLICNFSFIDSASAANKDADKAAEKSADKTTSNQVINCTINNGIEIILPGYFKYDNEAKKPQKIATLTPNSEGFFDKALDVGDYRFIKSGFTNNQPWVIQKKFGNVYKKTEVGKFPVKIFSDQPIYVSSRENNQLEIRRNIGDDNNTSTFVFNQDQTVKITAKIMYPAPLAESTSKVTKCPSDRAIQQFGTPQGGGNTPGDVK